MTGWRLTSAMPRLIVRRSWLKFYSEKDKPDAFDQIDQSWDTPTKSLSSPTTAFAPLGGKGPRLYLLDVFRRKLEFPELKHMAVNLRLSGAPMLCWSRTNR
jgi:hypothetical protein